MRRVAERAAAKRLSSLWVLVALTASACGGEKLESVPPYTMPPAVVQVGDIPGKKAPPDGGTKQTQPQGCAPLSPPMFCHTVADCPATDICISYTCEPACFSQCGDYPPGLPNCPNPLVCVNGVCAAPSGTTSGTTSGSSGTSGTTSSTSGTTSGTTTSTTSSTSGATCTDPSLAGDWSQTSYYYIAQGVANGYPGFLGIINEVNNFLSTWAYVGFIPSWVSLIFSDLSNFDALFDNLWVQADQELVPLASNPYSYTCTETWQTVQVQINGTWTAVQPQDGYSSPAPYEVDSCSGTTTFQPHDISGAVSGLIPPLLDAIVQADCEIQGCPYTSFSNLMTNILSDLIPCSSLDDGSIFGSIAAAACQSAENAVVSDIDNELTKIPLGIGICTVTAQVPTDPMTLMGSWQGNVSGTPFSGTLDATHN